MKLKIVDVIHSYFIFGSGLILLCDGAIMWGVDRLLRSFRRLTEPRPPVTDCSMRLRARFVAGVLYLFVSVGYAITASRILAGSRRDTVDADVLVLVGMTIIAAVAQRLIWRGDVMQAAQLIAVASSAGIMLTAALDNHANGFVYLIMPLIFSSAVLPTRFTSSLVALDMVGVLLIPLAASGMTISDVAGFALPALAVGALLVLAVSVYHDREDMRRASTAYMRTVLENMPVMLVALDDDGTIVMWNHESERVTGFAASEVTGNPTVAERLFSASGVQFNDLVRATGDFRDWEWAIVCKSGQTRTIAWSSIATESPVPGWATWAVGVDITDRRQAEDHRLRLAVERQRVDLLRRFLGSASHDLRTPIATLKTSLYILGHTADPNRVRHHLALASQQIDRLTMLLDKMLEALRVDVLGEYAEHTLRELDLVKLAEQVVSLSKMHAKQKRMTLTYTAPGIRLPVLGDTQNLAIAIGNVIENALNFAPDESEVAVRVFVDGTNGVVEVCDHGPGIDAAILPHIFEHFFRGDYARRSHTGGAGLGLTVARNVITAHGGSITVESVVGQGSIFRLLLPLLQEPLAKYPGPRNEPAPADEGPERIRS